MPIYLKYGSIKGEVKEPAHRGWIELSSMQWGTLQRSPRPFDRAGGRASPAVSDIVVTKRSDSVSILLMGESLSGKQVDAVIDFVKGGSGKDVYLRIEMSGTSISSFNLSGSGDNPTESLTLNFTKVETKFTPGTPAETDDSP
jgi:type VI secretion system secreted protein Hcp